MSRNECEPTVLARLLELVFGVNPARHEVLKIGIGKSLNLSLSATAG